MSAISCLLKTALIMAIWVAGALSYVTCDRIPFAGSSVEFGSCVAFTCTGELQIMAARGKEQAGNWTSYPRNAIKWTDCLIELVSWNALCSGMYSTYDTPLPLFDALVLLCEDSDEDDESSKLQYIEGETISFAVPLIVNKHRPLFPNTTHLFLISAPYLPVIVRILSTTKTLRGL